MTQAFAVYYRPRFDDIAIFVSGGCIYLSSPSNLIGTFERINQQRGEFRIKFPDIYTENIPGFEPVNSVLASYIRNIYSLFSNNRKSTKRK
ncbi:MAG: hypothetical protein J4428_04930 [Candidatus Aenigmarchaeota archaeon]|nr:hypothetical protein [Candidatus Aenigmarchaeota archaeon]